MYVMCGRDCPNFLQLLLLSTAPSLRLTQLKKVCTKLQGAAAGTANWATNVGNERGEVVISVLTESENSEALQRMACGLMERYEMAYQDPPRLLYTDRDCCSTSGPSKYKVNKWLPICERISTLNFVGSI